MVGFLDQDSQLSAVYERENSMRNCFLWLGVMTLVVSSFGCGADTEDTNPVTGKITYDGKALGGARIRLEATAGGASRVYAATSKDDGTFDIEANYSTEVKKGAPEGTYKVLVGKFKIDTSTAEHDPDADEAMELEMVEQQTEGGEDLVEANAVKSSINEKFNNSSSTPLTVEIKAGENTISIDLKSDGTGTVK